MQKIIPFLWFNTNAEEAVNFYVSTFKNSKIGEMMRCSDMGPGPKGSVLMASFQLEGQQFNALNGGPLYKITPAISFFVNCATADEVSGLWEKLSAGGTVMMPLDKYPFSEQFGWVQDRFGVSWQLSLAPRPQKITPFMMFSGSNLGRAEEAIQFYTSIFNDSKVIGIKHQSAGVPGSKPTVMHAMFSLAGQEFAAIDAAGDHPFTFSEGLSLVINCDNQAEVDYYWDKLIQGGSDNRCAWLKDKFGVSWQVVPTVLGEMLRDKDPEKAKRVTQAMLQMDKMDIAKLKEAYNRAYL